MGGDQSSTESTGDALDIARESLSQCGAGEHTAAGLRVAQGKKPARAVCGSVFVGQPVGQPWTCQPRQSVPLSHIQLAVGQNQWYHFGVGAPPMLVGIGMFNSFYDPVDPQSCIVDLLVI